MRRYLSAVVFLLLIAAFAYPAQARRRPDWIDGASKRYPEPRYFTGVGSAPLDRGGRGQQMSWAGDSARAEVAKTIRAEVRVVTRAERTVGADSKPASVLTDVVTATAREALEGVEIKEYYRDRKERTLYALAVLDRYKAAKNLERRAQRIKQDIVSEVDAAGEARDRERYLAAISHFGRALVLARETTEIEDLLRILKPGGAYSLMEAPYHESTLREAMRRLRGQVRFRVTVDGPAANVRGHVINGLSRAGFVTAAGGSKSYDLKGTTELIHKGSIDMGRDMLMQIYQADLDLAVTDPASGEEVAVLTWSASANEKSERMAERSAVRALGEYVQRTIAERMGDIL